MINQTIISTLQQCRVLPVVTALDVESTLHLARALQQGGIKAIEITLRTDAALDSIRLISSALPDLLVAAGTITTPAELHAALEAGAELVLSPGSTPELLQAAQDTGAPFIPGIATASEIMQGMQHGFEVFKFFPAESSGGVDTLKSLAGPFPQIRFCPTGGLNPANFRHYLALPNVICCGGSWMTSSMLVRDGNWPEIEELAWHAMSD